MDVAKVEFSMDRLPSAAYTVHDVAEDTRLLMKYLDINSACVVGYSYGSMVAQLLTLKAPERVAGLVCLQGSNYNPDLPARLPAVEKAVLDATREYPTYRERVMVTTNLRIATNGSTHAMGMDEAVRSAQISVERMYYPQGTARMVLSRFATEPFFEQTSAITCPVLILHADEDPIFNLVHGEDMAGRIPGTELVVLEGAGHNHPLSLQLIIAEHLLQFANGISRSSP